MVTRLPRIAAAAPIWTKTGQSLIGFMSCVPFGRSPRPVLQCRKRERGKGQENGCVGGIAGGLAAHLRHFLIHSTPPDVPLVERSLKNLPRNKRRIAFYGLIVSVVEFLQTTGVFRRLSLAFFR